MNETKRKMILNIALIMQSLDHNGEWYTLSDDIDNYSEDEIKRVLEYIKDVCDEWQKDELDFYYTKEIDDVLKMISEIMED